MWWYLGGRRWGWLRVVIEGRGVRGGGRVRVMEVGSRDARFACGSLAVRSG